MQLYDHFLNVNSSDDESTFDSKKNNKAEIIIKADFSHSEKTGKGDKKKNTLAASPKKATKKETRACYDCEEEGSPLCSGVVRVRLQSSVVAQENVETPLHLAGCIGMLYRHVNEANNRLVGNQDGVSVHTVLHNKIQYFIYLVISGHEHGGLRV